MEAKLDPITDIFRTMHVTAFGQHRLEATAPWGLIQEKQTEEKVTPSDKKNSPTDLAHFAMLSRGNCWLSVEGISDPIPLTGGDCFLLGRDTSIVMRDSPRTRPRTTFREIAAKAKGNVAHHGGGGRPEKIRFCFHGFRAPHPGPDPSFFAEFLSDKGRAATHACSSRHNA